MSATFDVVHHLVMDFLVSVKVQLVVIHQLRNGHLLQF